MKSEENQSLPKRSELWNSIYEIINKIPSKDVEGDAVDAPSAATSIEKLILSLPFTKVTDDDIAKTQEALALLSSMVDGGEEHSETSTKVLSDAREVLDKLKTRMAAQDSELEEFTNWLWEGKIDQGTIDTLISTFRHVQAKTTGG